MSVQIIYYILSGVLAGLLFIANIITIIKSKFDKRSKETKDEIEQSILASIPEKLAQAEKMFAGAKQGDKKLYWVLTQIKLEYLQNGLVFDDEKINTIITQQISMSKVVNTKWTLKS